MFVNPTEDCTLPFTTTTSAGADARRRSPESDWESLQNGQISGGSMFSFIKQRSHFI